MKFGIFVADIFIIKHTQFGQDAFGLDTSIVHCLWVQSISVYRTAPVPMALNNLVHNSLIYCTSGRTIR